MTESQISVMFVAVDGVVLNAPNGGDASAIGPMHLLSWQQTYPIPEHGIDAEWIIEHMSSRASPAADDFCQRPFASQRARPEEIFYRVTRKDDEVVGLAHASPAARTAQPVHVLEDTAAGGQGVSNLDREDATLKAHYLLRDHQGIGLADHLMTALLAWLSNQAMRPEVASYNSRAIGFYERYDIHLTGETALFRKHIPVATMRGTELGTVRRGQVRLLQ